MTRSVDPFGFRSLGGVDERGPAALARVAVESELRHDESLPAGVEEGAVHLPRVVREDPQVRHLVREPLRLGVTVVGSHSDQDDHS